MEKISVIVVALYITLYVFLVITTSSSLQWYQKFTEVDDVIPVSAKYGQGVDDVKDWILSKLPFGPAYYPKVCRLLGEVVEAEQNLVLLFLHSFPVDILVPNSNIVTSVRTIH